MAKCSIFLVFLSAIGSVFPWPNKNIDCSPCTCERTRLTIAEKLRNMNFGDCSYRNLTGIPRHLPRDLEALNLDGNHLGDAFDREDIIGLWAYNKTKYLSLRHANIEHFPRLTLLKTTKLQHLDLTGNEFDYLDGAVFRTTKSLMVLNGLDSYTLPDNLFFELESLRYLELILGRQVVPENLLGDLTLKSLDLTLKVATTLPVGLFERTKTTLQNVIIRASNMYTLPEKIFSPVSSNLRVVELHLPNSERLYDELFQVGRDETSHIEHLTIDGVRSLVPELLNNLPNLAHLTLNNVEMIPSNLFAGLLRLDHLDLIHTNLLKVKHEWFDDLGKGLKFLFLARNNLTRVSGDNFTVLDSVTHLDLSHNQISSVDINAFVSMEYSLNTLNMSHNKICSLPLGVFDKLNLLEKLSLEFNCLTDIQGDLFQKLDELKELYLQNNDIKSFTAEVLIPLGRLEVLNISSCQIRKIPRGSFSTMEFLTVLDFSNNTLDYLPLQLLPDRSVLKEVYLGDNPLHCDCAIAMLTFFKSLGLASGISGVCASPPHLQGREINNIGMLEFCSSPAVTNLVYENNPQMKEMVVDDDAILSYGVPVESSIIPQLPGSDMEPDAVSGAREKYVYSSVYQLVPLREGERAEGMSVYYGTSPLREEIRPTDDGLTYFYKSSAPLALYPPPGDDDVTAYVSLEPLAIERDARGHVTFAPPPSDPLTSDISVDADADDDGDPTLTDLLTAVITSAFQPASPRQEEARAGGKRAPKAGSIQTGLIIFLILLAAVILLGTGSAYYYHTKVRGSYTVNKEGLMCPF